MPFEPSLPAGPLGPAGPFKTQRVITHLHNFMIKLYKSYKGESYSLLDQQDQQYQQGQSHQKDPVRQIHFFTFTYEVKYSPNISNWRKSTELFNAYQHFAYANLAKYCTLSPYVGSGHSLQTRMSTKSLHASFSFLSCNTLLTTRARRSLLNKKVRRNISMDVFRDATDQNLS